MRSTPAMRSLTSRLIVCLALASLCLARGLAQQTALTKEQLKSAEIEVPRLVQVLVHAERGTTQRP